MLSQAQCSAAALEKAGSNALCAPGISVRLPDAQQAECSSPQQTPHAGANLADLSLLFSRAPCALSQRVRGWCLPRKDDKLVKGFRVQCQ